RSTLCPSTPLSRSAERGPKRVAQGQITGVRDVVEDVVRALIGIGRSDVRRTRLHTGDVRLPTHDRYQRDRSSHDRPPELSPQEALPHPCDQKGYSSGSQKIGERGTHTAEQRALTRAAHPAPEHEQ